VLAGQYVDQLEGPTSTHAAVVRLLPDGRPDASFGGGDGIAVVLDGYYGFTEVALQPDGRIDLAGYDGLGVTRLQGDVGPYVPAGTQATQPAATTQGRSRGRPRIAVGRRMKVALPCPARRRCRGIVRVAVGGNVVATRRFSLRADTKRLAVRLSGRALRSVRRRGTVPARLEVRIGTRRVVQRVLLTAR